MDAQVTPLYKNHKECGAKMGLFAGYDMPLYYAEGVIKEHEWVRSHAGLFDVSHMGQIVLRGSATAEFLEKMTPSAFQSMVPGRARYTVLTNQNGGIVDDLIITRLDDETFFAVINAGCKEKDIAWIQDHLPGNVRLEHFTDRILLALQGPDSERVLNAALSIDASDQPYMWLKEARLPDGTPIYVSRLGYTGEDGFELSIPEDKAAEAWRTLLAHSSVKPVGLAARDGLRLEMGYPLYGHDIDDRTSPVEAGLQWVIGKTNKTFIGHERILSELENGASKHRVGVKLLDKGIAREGAKMLSTDGDFLGFFTSGGYSPVLQASIGMGYIEGATPANGSKISVEVRGKTIAAEICDMPFMAAKTKSMKKKDAA